MFCPHCGKQSASDARFCSFCGASAVPQPGSFQSGSFQAARIVRPRHPRMIAGVCSGVAIHYGWDIALVRIFFAVFTCITSGIGLVVYLAAWAILPDAPYALPPAQPPAQAPTQSSN